MALPKSFTRITPFSKWLALILFIICPIIGFYLGVYYQQQISKGLPDYPDVTRTAKTFCGGIAGKQCPAGYMCKLAGNYPDAGGTCIKAR